MVTAFLIMRMKMAVQEGGLVPHPLLVVLVVHQLQQGHQQQSLEVLQQHLVGQPQHQVGQQQHQAGQQQLKAGQQPLLEVQQQEVLHLPISVEREVLKT